MPPLRHIWLGTVAYREAWDLQRRLAKARRAGEIDDCLVLLEHPAVFTMGRTGDVAHLGEGVAALEAAGAEYADVDRGGSVTFHGPGQLVGYPIVDIASAFPIPGAENRGDVMRHLRALEEALIATAADYGVTAVPRQPYTGVWIEPSSAHEPWRKLAAIGVKLAGRVTTHGVALNVTTDLSWFDRVTPCGIPGAAVCSLESLTGATPTLSDVAQVLAGHVALAFGREAAAADDAIRGIVSRIAVAQS